MLLQGLMCFGILYYNYSKLWSAPPSFKIQNSLLFVVPRSVGTTNNDPRLRRKVNAEYLAMFDNYHLPQKNASYHLVILHGHLWGGRFQMAVVGERQVTGENVRNPSGPEG